MPPKKPSVGRIVHYFDRDHPNVPLAAVIVKVFSDECVNLKVFGNGIQPGVDRLVTSVIYGKEKAPDSGAWDWPEQV